MLFLKKNVSYFKEKELICNKTLLKSLLLPLLQSKYEVALKSFRQKKTLKKKNLMVILIFEKLIRSRTCNKISHIQAKITISQ